MEIPAFIISVFAMAFTLASFWWLHWRTGQLRIAEPRTYQGFAQKSGKMVLTIPFVFFNDGPTPILVSNLRLKFLHEPNAMPLSFVATIERLATRGDNEGRAFATPFPVTGREAARRICEFQREPAGWEFEVRQYRMVLEAKIGTPARWKKVSAFSLHVKQQDAASLAKQLLTHDMAASED